MSPVRTIALVSREPGELRDRLAALGRLVELNEDELDQDAQRTVLSQADCVVVAAPATTALAAIRRLHSVAPALQVIVVAPSQQKPQLERALLFAPGLGEVWLTTLEELSTDRVESAATVTAQRRRYRVTRKRLEDDQLSVESQRGRRALISDAYLAALLQVLPHPVLSIDEGDRVLSWNPAAEQLFGVSSAEAVGRPLLDVLAPLDRPQLEMSLAEGARVVHRSEATLHRRGGDPRIVEVTVAPVNAAGHRVRAVVLHDITVNRRNQEALKQQTTELNRHQARLQQQTSELEELNRKLQQRSAELENALTSRSRFYAAMSHELRTPMNAIIGYNSLLLEGIYGPLAPRQADAVAKVKRAAEHLLELVNDVLDLAKIEAGRIDLVVESVHFPEVLSDLLDTVRPIGQEFGSELILEPGGRPFTILTDPRRVRQILLNLLSNAIKFGEGNPVRVRWRELPDGGIQVDVSDQGKGIAPEDISRIFDEFVQLTAQEGGGTGLGLPISRRLAHALGGRLEVRSKPGEGSTFFLTLPAALPAYGAEAQS